MDSYWDTADNFESQYPKDRDRSTIVIIHPIGVNQNNAWMSASTRILAIIRFTWLDDFDSILMIREPEGNLSYWIHCRGHDYVSNDKIYCTFRPYRGRIYSPNEGLITEKFSVISTISSYVPVTDPGTMTIVVDHWYTRKKPIL